ncbi:DUF5684 domain-containing protein [Agromyces sp. MMS24-JH15]|uniref:DUF5684 domain-containing protein n=1 Tax=Agromyces sp. MMS24-JH15 TaxID=3243765 RepID=UPI003747C08C
MDTTLDPAPLIAMIGAAYAILFLSAVGSYVLTGVFLSRILRKTGHDGWPAWVPVYSSWRFLEVGGQPGWLAVLLFVPIVNVVTVVFLVVAAYRIGRGFGKGGGFAVLYAFLPLIWFALLAFGRTTPWQPPIAQLAPIARPGVPGAPEAFQQ